MEKMNVLRDKNYNYETVEIFSSQPEAFLESHNTYLIRLDKVKNLSL